MPTTNFQKLSQEQRNKWMHALLNNMKTPSHLSRLKDTGLIEEAKRIAPEVSIPAPAVTYDNEVRARMIDDNPLCGMGLPPGTGNTGDGWREILDIFYPLTKLYAHDDNFKLECVAQRGLMMWRLSEIKGPIIETRDDLSLDDDAKAKTWAAGLIKKTLATTKPTPMYHGIDPASKAVDPYAEDDDHYLSDQASDFDLNQYKKDMKIIKDSGITPMNGDKFVMKSSQVYNYVQNKWVPEGKEFDQYKITEKDKVSAAQWPQKLIDRYRKYHGKPHVFNTLMDKHEELMFQYLTDDKNFPKHDDAADALKQATAIRLRNGEPINTNKAKTAVEIGTAMHLAAFEKCQRKFELRGATTGRLSGLKADMIIMDDPCEEESVPPRDNLTGTQEEARILRKQQNLALSYGMGKEKLRDLADIATSADMENVRGSDDDRKRLAHLMEAYAKQDVAAAKMPNKEPNRRGHSWSRDEEQDLKIAFEMGRNMRHIARFHGRTEGAIGSRLEKMDLAYYNHDDGTYTAKVNADAVDGFVRDEFGAMAVLDIKTTPDMFKAQYLDKPKEFGVLEIDSKIPLGNTGMGGKILASHKDEKSIIKPEEAIPHPEMFEAGCTYIHVHPKADEEFALYRTGTAPLSMGYIRDLQSMQDKFYKVKGELPVYNNYAKAATGTKYVLPNGMVVEQCCVQQVYKTPKKPKFNF